MKPQPPGAPASAQRPQRVPARAFPLPERRAFYGKVLFQADDPETAHSDDGGGDASRAAVKPVETGR